MTTQRLTKTTPMLLPSVRACAAPEQPRVVMLVAALAAFFGMGAIGWHAGNALNYGLGVLAMPSFAFLGMIAALLLADPRRVPLVDRQGDSSLRRQRQTEAEFPSVHARRARVAVHFKPGVEHRLV